jgi:hypothetical protein
MKRFRYFDAADLFTAREDARPPSSWRPNTRYMDAALNHLRSQGTETKPEEVARLSPLADKHFNVLGRYGVQVYRANLLQWVLNGDRSTVDRPEVVAMQEHHY